jgi:DNA modification methylase
MIAAKRHGRSFVGAEIDQDYFDKSIVRMEELTNE